MKNAHNKKAILNIIISIIYLLIVFGVILLAIFIPSFSWYWAVFIEIIINAPVGLVGIQQYVLSKQNYLENEVNRIKQITSNLIIYSYILDILFIIFFAGNITLKIISGILGVVIISINLITILINRRNKEKILIFCMIFDFLLSILIIIYLIYIIPNEKVQLIVTSIVSAIAGGLLTLVGVAWTIRQSEYNKQKDEIKKCKPLVFIVKPENIKNSSNYINYQKLIYNGENFEKGSFYKFNNIYIENVDYSFCSIKGLLINYDLIEFPIGQVLRKNSVYLIDLDKAFQYLEKIEKIHILLIDVLGNEYFLELNFELKDKDEKYYEINVLSGIAIKDDIN